MDREIISVTELNLYIKAKLDGDYLLSGVLVRGEISNFKRYESGHCYFTLKDQACAVSAVMFNSYAQKLAFLPENGMKVIACGKVGLYERDGKYQIYVSSLEPDGIGALAVAYEQLRKKLEAEGLFDKDRKKPIPAFPRRIGVITSPTGAAVRDIINIAGRRFPSAEIAVYPAVVQGDGSVPTLLAGLEYFNSVVPASVIIIGRGGGSIEDLWSFNDEKLVRAVAASGVPVISAVGHETDFTLCDFAADLRAPTPSAAAECATPDSGELLSRLSGDEARMFSAADKKIRLCREKTEKLAAFRFFSRPQSYIDDKRIFLDATGEKFRARAELIIQKKRAKISSLSSSLSAMDPLAVIGRGYAAVFDGEEKLIKSVKQVSSGAEISTRVADGEIKATVNSVKAGKRRKT